MNEDQEKKTIDLGVLDKNEKKRGVKKIILLLVIFLFLAFISVLFIVNHEFNNELTKTLEEVKR